MASGRVHEGDSIRIGILSAVVSVPIFYYLRTDVFHMITYPLSLLIGGWTGALLSPDLDVDIRTRSERIPFIGTVLFITFFPYAAIVPHRNFISHMPIVSTLLRQLYILLFIGFFVWLYGFYLLQIPINAETAVEAYQYANGVLSPHILSLLSNKHYWLFLIGLGLADFAHWLRDYT